MITAEEVNENEVRLICDQNKYVIPIKTKKVPGQKHKPFSIVFEPSPIRKGKTVISRSIKTIDIDDVIPENAIGETKNGTPIAGMRILDYLEQHNTYFVNRKIWIDKDHSKLVEDEKKNKQIATLEADNYAKEQRIAKLEATVTLLKKDKKEKGVQENV